MEKAEELARHEVGWWKAHHRRDKQKLTEHMTLLYELQFGISREKALEAVKHRVEAAAMHDRAEELEDKGLQDEADEHWSEAEKLLERHFSVLEGKKP